MKQIILLSRQWSAWRPCTALTLAISLLAFSAAGLAAKGGIPGPPTGGETSNNLSTPGLLTESVPENTVVANWAVPGVEDAALGVNYSYGCAAEEKYGEFKYPNTSCVDELMTPTVYYTPEQCVQAGNPCEEFFAEDLSRIYWQKVDVNEWWADDEGVSPESAAAAYVDWGDALEAVSWNERSVIRVETQPWGSTIAGFDPTLAACAAAAEAAGSDPEIACKVGFQMWHVSGQGITEHWGVRATDVDEAVSYNYDSPFQIIKTTKAKLSLTKLDEGDALCSMPGGNPGDDPPEILPGAWNAANGSWGTGTCTWYDGDYTVETSVGGKYVYGYNWRMSDVNLDAPCPGFVKTGFWRLTFYAPEDVLFTGHSEENPIPNVAPPSVPAEERELPRSVFNTILAPTPEPVVEAESDEEDPDADDRLYRPVVDPVNNLTYIDICIVAKTQGGGGGKGGGGGIGGGRDSSEGIGGGIGGGRDGGGSKGGGKH
jgi:hypothetical protein